MTKPPVDLVGEHLGQRGAYACGIMLATDETYVSLFPGLGRFDVAGAHLRELDARDDPPPRTRVQVLCGSMWLAYYVTDWTAVSAHLRAAVDFVGRVPDRAAATMLALSLGP